MLALKNKSEIYVTREVFEQVQDFSQLSHEENPWLLNESLLEDDYLRPRHGGGLIEGEEEEDDDDF